MKDDVKNTKVNQDKSKESSFQVYPTIAVALGGSDEAIVYQQIKYWITYNSRVNQNFYEGRYWVYNTYDKWHREFFHLSKRTIERIFAKLEKLNVIKVGRFNKFKGDRTKWYTTNEEVVNRLYEEAEKKVKKRFLRSHPEDSIEPSRQIGVMLTPDCRDAHAKSDLDNPQFDETNSTTCRDDTTRQTGGMYIEQRLHTKTTTKTTSKEPPKPPKGAIDLSVDGSLSEPNVDKVIDETEEKGVAKRSTRIAKPLSQEAAVLKVFEYWQERLDHRGAILDSRRREKIKAALRLGYTPENLMKAIVGCSMTPHNMGDNDRGQRYDGLHIILKDADQIERFMRNADNPPKPMSAVDRRRQERDQKVKDYFMKNFDKFTKKDKESEQSANLIEYME